MSIQNDCFTVSMQVGVWVGQRLDKKTTAKVTKEADAHSDAGRFNKHLIPKESLAEVTACVSALRGHLYSNSLPWKDNGDRLITRKQFQTFMLAHEDLRDKFNAAVEQFLTVKYMTAKDQAEFRMGELFDESDYPSPAILRQKFYVVLDIDAIADAKDFRLNTDETIFQARVTKAMEGLWIKLSKPLEHFATIVSEPDKVFRDSMVSNLRDIVEILPALNFTGDPKLAALGERIKNGIAGYDAKDLRTNPVYRSKAATEADEILQSMRGLMAAFGTKEQDDE